MPKRSKRPKRIPNQNDKNDENVQNDKQILIWREKLNLMGKTRQNWFVRRPTGLVKIKMVTSS